MSNYTEGDESDDEERDIYLSIRESAVNNQSETQNREGGESLQNQKMDGLPDNSLTILLGVALVLKNKHIYDQVFQMRPNLPVKIGYDSVSEKGNSVEVH